MIRPVFAALALMLAGCVQTTQPPSPAPAAVAPAQPAPVTIATPARAEPLTPERAKEQCWMKYEGDRKLNIDKRADLVDRCVKEKMAGRSG